MILREEAKQKEGRNFFSFLRVMPAVAPPDPAVGPTGARVPGGDTDQFGGDTDRVTLLTRGVRAGGDTAPNPKKDLSKPLPFPLTLILTLRNIGEGFLVVLAFHLST